MSQTRTVAANSLTEKVGVGLEEIGLKHKCRTHAEDGLHYA